MSEIKVKVGRMVEPAVSHASAVPGRKPVSADVEGQVGGGLLAFCPSCSTLVDFSVATSLGGSYITCWNCAYVFEVSSTTG